MRRQCELLGVARSRWYYHKKEDEEKAEIVNLIRDIWLKHPFYGYRKITQVLRRHYELKINGKRVLSLMQLAGIQAIYPKPKLSSKAKDAQVYPYLLVNITIVRVNQVWMVDITYLRLGSRFVYLVAIIDVLSRYIVGWQLSFDLATDNCLDALQMALKLGTPDILNSDMGCQFTSIAWAQTLEGLGIRISMDGKGRCLDNVYIERFWRTLKYEGFYLQIFANFKELYIGIKLYIEFYNDQRLHQALDYKTPSEIYYAKKYDNK